MIKEQDNVFCSLSPFDQIKLVGAVERGSVKTAMYLTTSL